MKKQVINKEFEYNIKLAKECKSSVDKVSQGSPETKVQKILKIVLHIATPCFVSSCGNLN